MSPNRVILVTDRNLGNRLHEIADEAPVWVVDSATNHPAIQEMWRTANDSGAVKCTSFKDTATLSPDELAVAILPAIEEHHGSFSQDPPFSRLTVIGAELSAALLSAAAESEFALDTESPFRLEFVRKERVPNQSTDPTP